MPMFATAEEFVAYRCFVQRVDEGAVTTWEVVDRFRVRPIDGHRIVQSFHDEDAARTLLATIRAQRLAEVNADPGKYQVPA